MARERNPIHSMENATNLGQSRNGAEILQPYKADGGVV